jgi:enediyne biosynthesis protein E4
VASWILVTNFGPNILYRNNGDGTFTDVTTRAGVGGGNIWHTGAAFADYDNDGRLDLYVAGYLDFDLQNPKSGGCEYEGVRVKACGPHGFKGAPDALYHNNGDGTFTDVTAKAGVVDRGLYFGFAVIFDDFDNDGFPDIFVANDSNPNYLYHNKGDGTFEEIAVTAGVAYSGDGKEHSGMGAAVGDYDNDGLMDLFVTTFANDNYVLYHNDGGNFFTDVSYPSGVAEPTIRWLGWGTFFLDYNNDGFKDLFCINGHVYPEIDGRIRQSYRQPLQLLENNRHGKFREVSEQAGLARMPWHSGRGGAYCDFDNDGNVDVVVSNIDDRPTLLRNEGGSGNNWLELSLAGTVSNRSAIGAKVKITAGDLVQYDHVRAGGSFLSGNDLRLHFGLRMHKRVDSLEIRWPGGKVDRYQNLEVNKILSLREK